MVQEGGKVIMKKVEDRKRKTLLPIIEKYVDKGTHITTDELPSYAISIMLSFYNYVYLFVNAYQYMFRGDKRRRWSSDGQ